MFPESQYSKIYGRMRAGMLSDALRLIYSDTSKTLKPPYSLDRNHSWYVVGDLLFKSKKYREASFAFRQSIAAREDDVQAYKALANSELEAGLPIFAERTLRAALRIDVASSGLSLNLACALFDRGHYRRSLNVLYADPIQSSPLRLMVRRTAIECGKRLRSSNRRRETIGPSTARWVAALRIAPE